ncbi:MAG TPA: C25 family cysteine peptidase, partial [Cyclobacteriaceae bacterium]|nr:C25 family cysteine peptidase [Cyclobacteriaceae bacterium]
CEFGRHDDPSQISSSELALIRKDGGAIGFVTASRPVNAASNAFLNNAFYESLFTREDGRFRDLGSVFRDTKNNSLNGVSNRNYALLADPSMHLAIPDAEIIATKISTVSGDDTLKALSKVVVEGEVRLNNVLDNTFQGTLVLELKDKEFLFNTFGDENPVFTYKSRSNTLFRGQATVSDGVFHTEFILPKNIAYQVGTGKLSMYAKNNSNTVDAIGGATDFKIGESENDDGSDKTPPQINVFIGDTTFVNGGIASSNTRLVARLFDVSGINIANYGVGNNLVAVLDNDQVFELGEYYLSDVDDFSKGTIEFPIEGLEPGLHTLEVRAWDVYNNGGSASVTFVVTGENQLAIEDLRNYPNPFFDETTFLFTHNRSGEDLQVFASIVDMMGQPVATLEYVINDSQYLVTLPPWNGTNTAGTKLSKGLYLLRVTVRSLLDGSKNEHISRLIISN